jgi:UDP-N-acetylglucosamine--N-acetylmuramyl-(pentapeptide) pyrophosphoryl-undecaprenol N-acetylglucosamine transferase
MSQLKILIAAGGTGGHIYPGLAMAEAFKARDKQAEIAFVGTAHGLENKIIPPKGYRVLHLPIGRLNSNVSLRERLTTVLMLPWAMIKSALVLRKEKPDFVLGVGGHASGPLLLMASFLGYRSAIWEPNAMPGLANRWLARYVDECWVVFEEARAHMKARTLNKAGMPVRKEIEDMTESIHSVPPFRVLIFGGSLGARGVNTTVAEMIKAGGEWLKDFQFVHQTGAADFARVKELYGEQVLKSGVVDLREYLDDMGYQYSRAQLVVSRAGASTLSELAACGKPAILIPFPFASDDHQRKNAESLAGKGAAVLIVQKDLTPERLKEEIIKLKASPETLQRMSGAIKAFHQPRAAEKLIAQFVERIEHASS